MKKNIYLFFIIGVLTTLISCNRQIDCPELEKEILYWFPYQENDAIELRSQVDDITLTFLVNNIEILHTTHYSNKLDCGTCDDQILINQNTGNSSFHVNIIINRNKIESQSYQIYDTHFTDYNSGYSELKDFQMGNNKYETVRIFEKNDSNGSFKKLILAKGFGIIGLVDSNDNYWIINDIDNTKDIKTKVDNISCG